MCGPLSPGEVRSLCESLDQNHVQLLSLRGCQVSDSDFVKICVSVARSRSLSHLNLSLGPVSSLQRTQALVAALGENRGLQTLLLHGTALEDPQFQVLARSWSLHPSLVSLDLGDCSLRDTALDLICGLLPPDGAKPGLRELTLSANPGISARGWSRFCVAMGHSSQLRVLNLDYNPLGDRIAEMLAVAVASSRTLETLDLEGTGITNHSAQVFLDLVLFYPTSLKVLVLAENIISPELQTQIRDLLSETKEEPIREKHRGCQPIREQTDWRLHSGAHAVLLTSGLGENLLDETEM